MSGLATLEFGSTGLRAFAAGRPLSPASRRLAAATAIALALAGSLCAAPKLLTQAEIAQTVPGATFHLDSPIGIPLPVSFAPDGTMSGRAGSTLAFFLGAEVDSGRWWIADGRLCKKWTKWFKAKANCVTLRREGKKLYWERPDGENGTATIVVPAPPPAQIAKAAPVPRRVVPPKPVLVEAPRPVAVAAISVISPAAASPAPEAETAAAPGATAAAEETAAPIAPFAAAAAAAYSSTVEPAHTATAATSPIALPVPKPAVPPRRPVVAATPAPAQPPAAATRPPPAIAAPKYNVANVALDDVLNVRTGPSHLSPIKATLPPTAAGLRIIGTCESGWCIVRYRAVMGWVNSYYLTLTGLAPARDRS